MSERSNRSFSTRFYSLFCRLAAATAESLEAESLKTSGPLISTPPNALAAAAAAAPRESCALPDGENLDYLRVNSRDYLRNGQQIYAGSLMLSTYRPPILGFSTGERQRESPANKSVEKGSKERR